MAKRKRGHDDGRSGVPQSSKKVKVASQSKDDERSRRRAKSKEEALPSGQIPVKADQAASPIEITQKSANVANRGSHLYQAENSERSTKKRSRSGKSKVNREPTSMFNVMPYSAKREVDNLRQNPVHIQERIETSNNAEAIPDAVVTQKGDLTPLRLPARDDEVSLQVSKSKKKRMKRKERRRKSHSTGDQPNKQGMSTQASSHVLHDQVQVRDAGSTLEKGIQQKRQQDKGKDLKTITSIPAQVPVGTRQGPGSPIARPDVDVEVRHSQSQRNSNQKASALHTPDAQMEEANTNKSIALDPKLSKRGGQLSTDKFQRSKQRTKTAIEQSLLDQARQEKRLAKQERRLQRRKLKDINKSQVSADEDQAASTELGRRIAKSKKGQMRPKESPSWSMSKVSGGQLVDVDPGFSDDEKFILIAFNSTIHVYATDSSLPLQKLRLRDDRDIVSDFAFSAKDPDHLYIGTRSGFIDEWAWRESRRLGSWNTQSSIRFLTTAKASEAPSTNHLVYTSDETFGGDYPYTITAHRLFGGDEAHKSDLKTLWRSDRPVQFLRVLEGGQNIIATSGSTILLGTTTEPNPPKLTELGYIWRQISCSEHITSADIRVRGRITDPTLQGKKAKKSNASPLDVAIGTLGGFIFIYRDLLGQLTAHDVSLSSSLDDPQRIHWHRNAVSSVKWSKDGNYLISGGQETVLVIHQLSTGRMQFLPNLMAPIKSIVISPTGTSYAVSLAENSAMIISTTELKPTFSVAGLRLTQPRTIASTVPFVPTVENPYPVSQTPSRIQFPSIIHPRHQSRLLVAVPSSIEPVANQSATYLQTVDVPSTIGLTTQALTRTTATTKNIAPDATNISTPDVKHISISSDGKWLATVDEWAPPLKDIDPLAFDHEQALRDQVSKKEIYLKIWSQISDSTEWGLSTRIDNPHNSNHTPPPSILALDSDPSVIEFVTLASDGYLRFWSPSKRIRDGQPVLDESGIPLMNWRCAHAIYLATPAASPDVDKVPQMGYIAYSPDGTVCVAGYRIADPPKIFIINTVSGGIATTIVSTFPSPLLFGLDMLSRSLLLYHSGELEIHDLVDNSMSIIPLPKMAKSKDPRKVLDGARLAVDAEAGFIAVAFLDRSKGGNDVGSSKGRVQIYDVGNEDFTTPVFEKTYYHGISEMLCSNPAVRYNDGKSAADDDLTASRRRKDRYAFVVIDRMAQIYTLSPPPPAAPSLLITSPDSAPQQVPTPPPSDDASQETTSQGPLASLFIKPSQQSTTPGSQQVLSSSAKDHDNDDVDAEITNTNTEESSVEAIIRDAGDAIPSPEYPVVSAERLAEVFDNAALGGNGFLPPVDVLFDEVVGLFVGAK